MLWLAIEVTEIELLHACMWLCISSSHIMAAMKR